MRTEQAGAVRLQDYKPTDYRIEQVHLDVRLQPEATRIIAKLAIAPRQDDGARHPLVLDGDQLTLESLTLDGMALPDTAYSVKPDRLEIFSPPGRAFELEIVTSTDPSANTKLMGLYRTAGTYCTQCEAEGFRRITYFLDRPDVLSVYTTRLEARKSDAPLLLSNGNLIASGDIAGSDRHFAVWHDPFPKPSYLFALVGGDLALLRDTFTTRSGREVDLRIYVEHGKEDRAGYAMDSLIRSMKWDEDVFGREYDLDIFMIVAVSDFNMGAMENKGLNIFNDKYVLADPQTATDQDYANIEGVIAHEYFHNWTGNRITCRDWFQLCLKEGLTVFRDQEFSSDERSRPVKRISDVRLLKAHQFPEDAGPLAHPVRPTEYSEINNFYTATVYEKGAEVIRMLKLILGDEGFRNGMDLYFDRHDGDASTIEDFLACFAEASGQDLDQFALWYHQSGTPSVSAQVERRANADEIVLSLTQSCKPTPGQDEKKPFHIPLRYSLLDPRGGHINAAPNTVNGKKAEIRDPATVLHLRDETATFQFTNVPHDCIVSLNGGFSAPISLDSGHDQASLAFIAQHDTDAFNRWQAMQSLCQSALSTGIAALRSGREFPDPTSLCDVATAIVGDPGLDPAFKALALTLPSEADIARDLGKDIDTDAVQEARWRLKSTLAASLRAARDRLEPDLAAKPGPFDPGAAEAGKRALLNLLYDYLGAEDGENRADAEAILLARFKSANNMTDRFSCLTTLVQSKFNAADEALDIFYQRYKNDHLVLDKWFMAQATAPGRETLERVRDLTRHPSFSYANPNKVRGLIGGFASGNQAEFNRPDGAGYRFVTEICTMLDKTNPQVAARLLSAFRSWRSLEEGRRAHAEAALQQLADGKPASPDVADIVQRCLT